MLRAFSPVSRAANAAAPTVDFSGTWVNELGSTMTLQVTAEGTVTGKYKTVVGSPTANEEFDLVGFVTNDLIAFCVNFGKYGSVTSWSAQHTSENNAEVIKTLWLLAENVPDAQEPAKLWGAVLTGYNNFRRR